MARVWLEYGWSMARAWLEIATPHSGHWSENAYTHRTEGLSPCATIQPGETINTNIPVAGVYIIRAANGRIQKKFGIK